MGAWGHGNLENDGALDLLSTISAELFARVIELLKHPNGHEYDSEELDELFVRIEMILALHKGGLISTSPEQKDLGSLFEPYLERWNAYYEGKAPEKRRKVIERTFVRLMKVVRKLHGKREKWVEVPFDSDDPKHKMVMDIFDSVERRGDPDSDANR